MTSFFCVLLGVIILSLVFLLLCGWFIVNSGFLIFLSRNEGEFHPNGTYQYYPICKMNLVGAGFIIETTKKKFDIKRGLELGLGMKFFAQWEHSRTIV